MKSPHLDPVWLRQKYEVEGLSTYEIAALVSRDPKRIYEKLKDFGIPTRSRGHNLRGKDNAWAQPGFVPHWTGRRHTEESKAKIAEKARGPKPWLRGEANGMYGATGAANPRYVDGSSPERQRLYASAEWKALLRLVYERDAYTCRRCGAGKKGPRSLHAHHVVPWAGNEALRRDPDNMVTVCRTCHEWIHSNGNAAQEWLSHSSPNRSSSPST